MGKFAAVVMIAVCVTCGMRAGAQTTSARPTCAPGDAVVWENTNTKAYHLPGDPYYGTTKHGAYACRSSADRAGYHLAGRKSGSKTGSTSGSTDTADPAAVPSAEPSSKPHHKHHRAGATPTPEPAAT